MLKFAIFGFFVRYFFAEFEFDHIQSFNTLKKNFLMKSSKFELNERITFISRLINMTYLYIMSITNLFYLEDLFR